MNRHLLSKEMPATTYYTRSPRCRWTQLVSTSSLSVGAMRDGRHRRRRRLNAATGREDPGAGVLYTALWLTHYSTILPSSRMESLIKEEEEDTEYEYHSTRSYSAVSRRARVLVFYSLQQCGSPRSATPLSLNHSGITPDQREI